MSRHQHRRAKVRKFTISIMVFMTVNFLPCLTVNANQLQVKKSDEYYMKIAIDLAKTNPRAPFAALIVDNKTGEILSKGLNTSKVNPTFHGEMVAINNCVKKHPHVDWSQVTLYYRRALLDVPKCCCLGKDTQSCLCHLI